jgi:hypothetical protein
VKALIAAGKFAPLAHRKIRSAERMPASAFFSRPMVVGATGPIDAPMKKG